MSSHSLAYLLKCTQHALRLDMDKALKPIGLTTPQLSVLSQLDQHPEISNAELARLSFVTAQTMHGIVKNLLADGLIERDTQAKQGRVLKTRLTTQGLKLLKCARTQVKSVEQEMFAVLSKAEHSQLVEILRRCLKARD